MKNSLSLNENNNSILLPFNKRSLDSYELILTENCNFRCKYCFDDAFSNRDTCSYNYEMSKDKIPSIINFIEKTKSKKEAPLITFFGGEPTLNWDFIEAFISQVEAQKLNYRWNMNTNLSLLIPDKIDFLVSKRVSISCSIDGIEEAHNSTRVFANNQGTWDKIMGILPCYISKFHARRLPVCAMMVVDNKNYKYLGESYLFLLSIGFDIVNILWNYDYPYTEEQYREIEDILTDLFVLKRVHPYKDLEERILSKDFTNIKKHPSYCKTASSGVTINPAGQLFFCHRLAPKMCDSLLKGEYEGILGNIYEGFTNKEFLTFLERRTNINKFKKEECLKCGALNFCKGGCIGAIRDVTNGYDKLPSLCRINRILSSLKVKIEGNC